MSTCCDMRFAVSTTLVLLLGCGNGSHDGSNLAGSGGHAAADAAHGGTDSASAGSDASGAGRGSAQAGAGGPSARGNGPNPAGPDAGGGSDHIALPQVYPPVRANTPTSLIADPAFKSLSPGGVGAGTGDAINLAIAVQERLYTAGPTEILRIVQDIDRTTSQLDTRPSMHACLTTAPLARTIALPGGQSFTVKLQCMSQYAGGWMAFGFDTALDDADVDAGVLDTDAGALDAQSGKDFYFIHGQDGGMGGAYRVSAARGDVEAWLTVADSRAPNNSQVVMHLMTNSAAGTTELALAGSGVGFCSAHLKTGHDFLFIQAKTNAPPPPGTPMNSPTQFCDASRTGCFATDALGTDLGGDAVGCTSIATRSFGIRATIDASSDPEGNVTPATIYQYFNQAPAGIPAF
jgi:hypothetical protein